MPDTTNQENFLDISEKTEETIKSAMKHLDIFGERLEKAKRMLSRGDFIQITSSDQSMEITKDVKYTSQVVKDVLKLRDDIREMKRHFKFLKKPYSMKYLKQKSKIMKKKDISSSLNSTEKNHGKERNLNEEFEIFEKQLMARFPRLYSETPNSQIEGSNSANLEKTDTDFNNSTLRTEDNSKINEALFFDDKIIDNGISYELIPEFYQELNFNTSFENGDKLISFFDANSDSKSMDRHISYIRPEFIENFFEAIKKLNIDSLSNKNSYNLDKNHNSKFKTKTALKTLGND
ncbi:hypothetical protein T552_03414 [Pneumocystis carinii B80]|uniref:Uncharacterized protein n=1 Tax=Pneumocystis carinii (strain B80) TaxID=1408658 RepID=A0A0W4ZBN2_PNEC8|nr:hypothetical protein T552_03414 [Pneumocystis carinii B80]KTW25801.1 hypothetical protein T552_03414 [Pneumocystis carinii B80]